MRSFADRVAVVTGAGGGIGRAVSLELARAGCHLAISDINEEALLGTAEEIRTLGRNVCTHRVDVSDKARMQAYVDEVVDFHGGVNILVNNAGVTVAAPFEDHTIEDWEWIVGINLWGVIYGTKFFLPHLKAADEAHVVNLSSVFGLAGIPAQTSYCVTKFAVRGLSEALWVELKKDNIGVTSIHPGGVRTDIAKSARTTDDPELKSQAVEIIERFSVTPEHCAKQIVKAIRKNKMRQLVTRESYLMDFLKRLSPVLPQRMLRAGYERNLIKGA
ncbi:MAG: SDR family NAD(P)-dependent oxidoreductase [Myxococcales bacterium]|nr:SDR family NAD(P)-dependent oxidoreductase [Myxococcales bacterium]